MRMIFGGLVAALISLGTVVHGEEAAPAAQQGEVQITVQDMDRQIQMVKEQIEKYNNFTKYFGRKADSLQARDFSGYRHAAALRDECKGIADDLNKHLKELETQRAKMMEQPAKTSK